MIQPTSGQMMVATNHARSLVDAVYAASQQTEGSPANLANVAKAKAEVARIAELLGCADLARQIRSAA